MRKRSFNWEAALMPCWGWYRGVEFARGLSLLFPFFVAAWLRTGDVADETDLMIGYLVVWAGYGIVYGLAGDWMLQRAMPKDAGTPPPAPTLAKKLLRTLLSVVLVVASLMIVVVVESFRPHVHPKPVVSVLKSDLRNLVTAQEAFFADYGRYASTIDSLLYEPSYKVSVSVRLADSTSFVAEASYLDSAIRCQISVGNSHDEGTPVDTLDGVPVCDTSGSASHDGH